MRHRQQLQRRDAKPLEVVDHHRVAQRLIGSADGIRQPRVAQGQPFDVRFVDNGFTPRGARCGVVLPVVRQVYDHRFWRYRRAVAFIRRIVAIVKTRVVYRVALGAKTARVQQQLCRVKAEALLRIPRAMHPITVT